MWNGRFGKSRKMLSCGSIDKPPSYTKAFAVSRYLSHVGLWFSHGTVRQLNGSGTNLLFHIGFIYVFRFIFTLILVFFVQPLYTSMAVLLPLNRDICCPPHFVVDLAASESVSFISL